MIQEIPITTRNVRQPEDTSTTKIKVYRAKMLKMRQTTDVMIFTFLRLSRVNPPCRRPGCQEPDPESSS